MGIQTEPRHLRGQLYFWTNSGGSGLGVHPYNRDRRSGVRVETFPCCETRNTAEDSEKNPMRVLFEPLWGWVKPATYYTHKGTRTHLYVHANQYEAEMA